MNPLKWKWLGGAFAFCSLVFFAGLKYIGHLRRKVERRERELKVVVKRGGHRVAMVEADKEGAQNASESVEKAVKKAKTDNSWSRFTK